MELRQLRYFVTVAEELHFSRAAARLHLAQSALSSQIRRLETEVGGPLLVRSTRQVQLTVAGELLLAEGRTLLAAADSLLARAGELARGEAASFSIGALGPVPGALLSPLLATFSGRHPRLRIDVRAIEFYEMTTVLRRGRVDAAFLYAPLKDDELRVTPLISEPRVVVLPRSHRLAGREWVTPAELEGETFVAQPDVTPQEWRDYWMLVAELGRRPPISPYVGDNLEEWLYLIGRGEGVDTAPAIIARYFVRPDVAFVPLRDAAPTTLVLATRREQAPPLLDEFVALAAELALVATRNPGTGYAPPVRLEPHEPTVADTTEATAASA